MPPSDWPRSTGSGRKRKFSWLHSGELWDWAARQLVRCHTVVKGFGLVTPLGRSAYCYFMTNVRPTLRVLKVLSKGDLLPRKAADAYQAARALDDVDTKVAKLAEIDIGNLDVNLLRAARRDLADGGADHHVSMTREAKRPVYEVRSYEGAAWRGAVVRVDDDPDLWMVHADSHDEFNRHGSSVIKDLRINKRLGPSDLDRRLRDMEEAPSEERTLRQSLLLNLVSSLASAVKSGEPTQVDLPGVPEFEDAQMLIEGALDLEDLDVGTAHAEVAEVLVRLIIPHWAARSRDQTAKQWLLSVCVPFLQPNSAMQEAIYSQERGLTVQLILSKAQLAQLLAGPTEPLEVRDCNPAPPTRLHYTAKVSLVDAYVDGRAVRAVCGEWWVPTGDDSTHADLPICPECEEEEPFAQLAVSLLDKLRDP